MTAVATRTDRSDRTAARTQPVRIPECVRLAAVFQDDLVEQPPASSAPSAVRQRAATLAAQARAACSSCPLAVDCLYRAVVDYDVNGFVAGTTERQRTEIRRRLRVFVVGEDFDTLAGVTGGHRAVDHDEILRLRRSYPDESLDKIARRLGCSLSTVKRHLRQERREPSKPAAPTRKPSVHAVLAAAGDVLGRHSDRSAA